MLFEVGRGDKGARGKPMKQGGTERATGRTSSDPISVSCVPPVVSVRSQDCPSKVLLSHSQSGEPCRKDHGGVGRRSLALKLWASVVRVGFLAFCCKEAATAREDPSHAPGQTRPACPDGGRPGCRNDRHLTGVEPSSSSEHTAAAGRSQP